MNKFHIPFDLILQNGEDNLHEKVGKDPKFRMCCNEFSQLIDDTIEDDVLKEQISEASMLVYVFAEIAAYKEGFVEGIRFLINTLGSVEKLQKISGREEDLINTIHKFFADK